MKKNSFTTKANGYELIDYGHGISAEELISNVIEDGIKFLLISVLMYPSALRIKLISDTFKNQNIDTKILVGGAPFNFDNSLWKIVGADAMGKNASDSLRIIDNWLQEVKSIW